MEFPLVFLHVPCRGIACRGKMGSLNPSLSTPSAALSKVYLPVTMLLIGYSWRARYGNSPWAGTSESVSSLLYQEGEIFVRTAWNQACTQIPPPKVGRYLSARSSTSSSVSSSQSFLAASGSSVRFSLHYEYQCEDELQLCPGSPAEHLGHTECIHF